MLNEIAPAMMQIKIIAGFKRIKEFFSQYFWYQYNLLTYNIPSLPGNISLRSIECNLCSEHLIPRIFC